MPPWLDMAFGVLVAAGVLIFAVWVKWSQFTGEFVPKFLRRRRKQ